MSKSSGNKPSLKMLDTKVSDLQALFQAEIDKFRGELSVAKTPENVGEFDFNNLASLGDRFSAFEAFIKSEIVNLQNLIKNMSERQNDFESLLDDKVQDSYRRSLLITGFKESESENLYDVVLKLFVEKFSITVNKEDIDICYRLGSRKKRNGDKQGSVDARPVVVKFLHGWKRDEIYREKRRLKGSGVVFHEMLSPKRNDLRKSVSRRFEKCWTFRGRVGFVFNSTVYYVSTHDQLSRILSATATPVVPVDSVANKSTYK